MLPGCLWPHGCSGRRRARPPARLGDLTSFGTAPRSSPVPSGPSGALHTGGAVSLGVARPGPTTAHGHRSQAHQSLRRLRCSPRRQQRRFCTTRSPLAACRRRVGPPCSAIPPVWWLRGSALRGRGRPTKAILHVIPRRLLHSLNYNHWNCNVCRLSQKVTALNYVRLLEEAAPDICHGTTCIKGHFRHH